MANGLTDGAIKAAKPREKRYTLFDTGGLYLEVAPKGGKWWRLRYRYAGKTKVMSLGIYPTVSLKNAREKRDAARTLLANGGDPLAEKGEKSSAPDFATVAEEWFQFKSRTWAERTRLKTRNRLEAHLLRGIPCKPFPELEAQDFLRVIRKVETQGKHVTAHQLAQICGQIVRYAKLSGVIKYNPIQDIADLLVPAEHKHFATTTDPEKIGNMLADIRVYSGTTSVSMALRILPYVFVRSGEIRGARWSEIDFDSATWTIPAARMKTRREHVVPLANQVVELFMELFEYGQHRGDLCFPSPMSATRQISDVALLNGLRRIGYGRDEMCIHGFRSMASTLLNERGYRPDIIEAQLAHVDQNQIRAAYNHATYLEERRAMMQDWADYLDDLRIKAES
jgi:integrase